MDLKGYFAKAMRERWAVGHFNFSTADQLKAIVEAAAEVKSPVMVGTSEGEAKFIGYDQAVALVRSYQNEGHPVFLNADHHKSWETAKTAIDAGYDTVLIDASRLPYGENIAVTKKVVDYAKSVNQEIAVEGELGYLKGESRIQEKVKISPEDYTKLEEAREFVNQTGIERLAIAFGNIHGIVMEQTEKLDFELLKKITAAVPGTALVLHGGSGLPAEDVKRAIEYGITNVHINTDLRLVYHEALAHELDREPEQTTPYKYLTPSFEAMRDLVKQKLELFGSAGKV